MINDELKKRICELSDQHLEKMMKISDFLFKNPELGGEEYVCSRYLIEKAKQLGFKTKENYCDLDTAFLAELDSGSGPVIGIIAEYDALPGFGPGGKPAHACGHNWISATALGTAMILANMKEFFKGKLRLIGTPAMENLGCKAEMIKMHAFDDVDIVMQPHLEHYTSLYSDFLALDAIEFSFKGRSSHAAASPEKGVNALDAVHFMFVGMNALRQYLRSDVKIHGIISEGGDEPSVIPEKASCRYYIRAKTRSYLEEIKPKIVRCAEGAAMMAGAEMSMSYFENPYDNMIGSPMLQKLALEYLESEGIELTEDLDADAGSSSDIGNVSHVCPTLYMEFKPETGDRFRVHDKIALEYVHSEYSREKLSQVTKIMAGLAVELFNNEELVEKIKKEHSSVMRKHTVDKS